MRIHIKPFVSWIWGGCLLMALGGALAASDRRYRLGVRPQRASVAVRDAARGAASGAIARETGVQQEARETGR
jgi:cytochrome c-type biogenesis protein CcmF